MNGISVDFEGEIDRLNEEIEKAKQNNRDSKSIAITQDIINIAKEKVKNRLTVNYDFAKRFDYITTGILTSKTQCKENRNVLINIIRIFQKTINDIYEEPGSVEMILDLIANKLFQCTISKAEQNIIYDLLDKGSFYDRDLIVDKKLWQETINRRIMVERKEEKKKQKEDLINKSFKKYVNNHLAIKAKADGSRLKEIFIEHKIGKPKRNFLVVTLIIYILFAIIYCGVIICFTSQSERTPILISTIPPIIFSFILFLLQRYGMDNKQPKYD
jgi:DNA-binding XRE family transcriptional regulator